MDPLKTENPYRLVLVIYPRGSGRTTLLMQLARQQAEGDDTRVAWLTLEEIDNQPEHFLADLDQALRSTLSPIPFQSVPKQFNFHPTTKGRFDEQALEVALTERINAISKSPGKIVIVLNNFEEINSIEIFKAVGLLLDYLPPQALIVIASGSEPPLPLARLRVRRQLLELTEAPAQPNRQDRRDHPA